MKNVINTNTINSKSTLNLILANIYVIVFALIERWSLQDLMFVYVAQSIIIGIFHFKRILNLEKFSTESFRINGNSVLPTVETKKFTAYFFLMHYMIFHFVYLMFVIFGFDGKSPETITFFSQSFLSFLALFSGILVFGINHYTSFKGYLEVDRSRIQKIGTLMFLPYARIIPMHLTLVFALNSLGDSYIALLGFLLLKTVADVIMHLVAHNGLKQETIHL